MSASEKGQELTEILDAIADAVRTARAMPMSASVLVNRAELLDMVEAARALVPTEIARAQATLKGADDTISSAREQAETIRSTAREQAEQLLADSQIAGEARRRAAEIESRAQVKAAELTRGADAYCDRKLAELEAQLARVQREVAGGRRVLAEQLAERDAEGPSR